MRKLLININDRANFILAIAAGADIDATYKNQTLLEYCLDKMNLEETAHVFSIRKCFASYFEKYKILLSAGADATPLIINKETEISFLQEVTIRSIRLLLILLENEIFRQNLCQDNRFCELCCKAENLLSVMIPMDLAKGRSAKKEKRNAENPNYEIPATVKAEIAVITDLSGSADNSQNRLTTVITFERCMHDIYLTDTEPQFEELRQLVDEGADLSEIERENGNPVFTLSRLVNTTGEFLELLYETICGKNAAAKICKSECLTENFCDLSMLLKELVQSTKYKI